MFVTRKGNSLNRSNIWAEMKRLCIKAGVLASKVFPHNLRHLFGKTYYAVYQDIVRLSDILGHSSINTARIYNSGKRRSTPQENSKSRSYTGLFSTRYNIIIDYVVIISFAKVIVNNFHYILDKNRS